MELLKQIITIDVQCCVLCQRETGRLESWVCTAMWLAVTIPANLITIGILYFYTVMIILGRAGVLTLDSQKYPIDVAILRKAIYYVKI